MKRHAEMCGDSKCMRWLAWFEQFKADWIANQGRERDAA